MGWTPIAAISDFSPTKKLPVSGVVVRFKIPVSRGGLLEGEIHGETNIVFRNHSRPDPN